MVKTKLMCANFHISGVPELEQIKSDDFLDSQADSLLKKFASEVGLQLVVRTINDPEKLVSCYFSKQGYTLCKRRVDFQGKLPDVVDKKWDETGKPDFFCYKNELDWFFVEVKSRVDGLKMAQVLWIMRNKLPTKVIFVELVS